MNHGAGTACGDGGPRRAEGGQRATAGTTLRAYTVFLKTLEGTNPATGLQSCHSEHHIPCFSAHSTPASATTDRYLSLKSTRVLSFFKKEEKTGNRTTSKDAITQNGNTEGRREADAAICSLRTVRVQPHCTPPPPSMSERKPLLRDDQNTKQVHTRTTPGPSC